MARGPLNTLSLSTMIVLAMLTAIFVTLFIFSSTSVTASIEGDPNDPMRKDPLNTIASETLKLQHEADANREAIALREREIHRLDIELAKFRTHYVGQQQIAGTTGEDLTWNGTSYKAKNDPWLTTRDLTTEIAARLNAAEQEFKTARGTIFSGIESEIDARSQEQQAVLQHVNEMDAAFKVDEERLIAAKDELEKKKAESEKTRRVDFGTRESAINKKEDSIRSLLELELHWASELDPDGTILDVAADTHQVVINLGSKDRAFPGLLFDVCSYERGQYVVKGRLEVISVQDHLCTGRITSERNAKTRPVARGDFVANPVFDKQRAPIFTLAGEFQRFNKADLANFIIATGGQVVDTLGPNVNFMVVDRPAKDKDCRSVKEQDLAREYLVQAMTEDDLLNYVQTRFSIK